MRTPTRPWGVILVVFLGLYGGSLRAEGASIEVEAQYEQAKALLQSKQYDRALEACWRGLEAVDLPEERRWGFLSGAAMAYEGLQQPVHSLEMYHRLLREIGARGDAAPEVWRKRRAQIGEFVRRFEAEVLQERGAVGVDSTPRGARVAVDGQPYGPDGASLAPTTLYLAPGAHRLRFELPGRVPVEIAVTTRIGLRDQAVANLALVPVVTHPTPAPEPAQVVVEAPEPARPSSPPKGLSPATDPGTTPLAVEQRGAPSWLQPLWGWVLLGSGGALVLGGVPFTVLAFNDADALTEASKGTTSADRDRYDSLKASVQTKQVAAGVLYGVGGAVLAGGAAWLIAGHVLGVEAPASTVLGAGTVGVLPAPGGFSVTFGGRF